MLAISALGARFSNILRVISPFLIDIVVYRIFANSKDLESKAMKAASLAGGLAVWKIVPQSRQAFVGGLYVAYKVVLYFYALASKQCSQTTSGTAIPPAQSSVNLPIQTVISQINIFIPQIEQEISTEGLYRTSGSALDNSARLNTLKDTPSAVISIRDVLHKTAFVKILLRALKPRLLEPMRDFFISESYKHDSNLHDRLSEHLTPDQLNLLRILTLHLRRVAQSSAVNKMNSENLATCIGPSFFAEEFDIRLNEGIRYLIDHPDLFQ